MKYFLPALTVLFFSFTAQALTIVNINTEFLWDHKYPHEGRVVKNPPTEMEYKEELKFFASFILGKNASIVGLTEIEGCHVAIDLANTLGVEWKSYCRKGRDSYTGQDVAILSVFDSSGVIDDHSSSYASIASGLYMGKSVRPSKALTVVLTAGDKSFLVTVAHLISRRSDQDFKRLAQATGIKNTHNNIKNRIAGDVSEVVMGDFNDYTHSSVLSKLMGGTLVNTADVYDCSYTYRGRCDLIDHILVSPDMSSGRIETFSMPEIFSDHKAVVFEL